MLLMVAGVDNAPAAVPPTGANQAPGTAPGSGAGRQHSGEGLGKRNDRIPSTTPGAEPPRDAKDSGSARSHSTHLETSSSDQP